MTPKQWLLSALLTVGLILPGLAEKRRLIILHTNDLHGHLEAEDDRGFVRVASLIRDLKLAFPGEVVLLDGGDTSLGTPTSGLFFGIPMAKSMASVGYDAITLGNHEFNWGKQKLFELTRQMKSKVLCANLIQSADSEHPFPLGTVVERNGCKLGIFGLVTPDTMRKAPREATEGWEFLAAADGARLALQQMPEVDAVIALTHLGVKADRKLVKAVPGIDLVVGGHSHTALTELVEQDGVPIVQAGCYAQYLGCLEVSIDTDKNKLTVVEHWLLPINTDVPLEPAVSRIVNKYAAQVRPILDKVVGQVSQVVKKTPTEGNYDTPLGNLIADVIKETTGADVAFYNRYGVRTDMAAGPLTVGAIHKLFPFNDPIVVMTVSGEQLKAVVRQGTSGGEGPLSPSGLRATISDRTGSVESVTVGGEPLQLDKQYSLATTQFLATGGDGMAEFQNHKIEATSDFPRILLQRFLEKNPNLDPPSASRLKRLP